MTSESSRCGSLLMVHCEKSFKRVCKSGMRSVNFFASSFVDFSCSS
jgi:hypothetical protein